MRAAKWFFHRADQYRAKALYTAKSLYFNRFGSGTGSNNPLGLLKVTT
jgi:hypothetical protein